LSNETSAPLGQQRKSNYALQPMPRDEFIRLITADQPSAPAYFSFAADRNKRARPTLDAVLARVLVPLAPRDVAARMAAGALAIDTRPADAFAKGHLRGAVNIGLDGKFATWVGSLVKPSTDLVLVAEPGTERETAERLGRIGFDRIQGYAEGGARALADAGLPQAFWQRIEPKQLESALQGPQPPLVLDVRAAGEWRDGHVDGALHVPLDQLEARIGEIPKGRTLAVMCRSGYRSSIAASLLARAGHTDLIDVAGGWVAWAGACAR